MDRRYPARRILVWPLLFGIVCGVGLTAWKNRQTHLDNDLLAAIRRDDSARAIQLLNEGANANAAERFGPPESPGDLLHDLRDRFRGRTPPRRSYLVPALSLVCTGRFSHGSPGADPSGYRRSSTRALPISAGPTSEEHSELVAALLDHGADTVPSDGSSGPLAFAVQQRHYREVGLLLEKGGIGKRHDPRVSAALFGSDATSAKMLLDHGADPNAETRFKMTRLMEVVFGSYRADWKQPSDLELAELLVSRGANVNARDQYGQTPLMHAVNVPYARFLLDHGADVSASSHQGVTALMMACAAHGKRDPALPQYLISRGASVLPVDKHGQRARDYVVNYPHGNVNTDLLRMLAVAESAERRSGSAPGPVR